MAPILPIMPFIGWDAQKSQLQMMLHDELKAYLTNNGDPLQGDTYWASRQVAKFTDLAMLAQQLDYGQAKTTFLDAAKQQLEKWFTATDGDQHLFYYDDDWHFLIGYPDSYNSGDKANDQSLQFGYMINAAATIAQLDPDWAKQENWGGMVNEIIQNVNNWRRDDPSYAFLRAFDPYRGHNWASGTGTGITQESATESLNFDAAVARWGAATGQEDIEELGNYLFTTEAQAFMDYYLDVNKTAFPEGYDRSRVGILSATGAAYGTYFGGDPNYVQGINETPMLAQSSLFMGLFPNEIREDLTKLSAETRANTIGGAKWWLENQWVNIVPRAEMGPDLGTIDAGNTAKTDLASAVYSAAVYVRNGVKSYVATNSGATAITIEFKDYTRMVVNPGETVVGQHTQLGTIDPSVTGNAPSAEVYSFNGRKTYVASNASPTDTITVTFTDGVTLQVKPGDTAVRIPQDTADLLADRQGRQFSARESEWMNGTQMYLALANPDAALVDYNANPQYKSGGGQESRVYTLQFIQSLVAMGTIDGSTRADSPYASAYLKNGVKSYVAWNPTDAVKTYTFNDGVVLTVGPGDMVARAADGSLHTTDFNGGDITFRPAGIPLDLPTDPPAHALTVVASSHGVTLLVEAVTGSAWVKDGDGDPRALLGDGGSRVPLQNSAGARFVGIGRDTDGKPVVLLAAGANGSEPYYEKKLTDRYYLADVGGAQYNDAYARLEPRFGRDFNGDGIAVGGAIREVTRNGSLVLYVDSGDGRAYVKDGDKPMVEVRRDANGPATLLTRGGATLTGVGKDANGNFRVLDTIAGGGTGYAWQLDATGRWTGETVLRYGDDPVGTTQAEAMFQQDLNGDGSVPVPLPQVVTRNGNLFLLVDAGGYAHVRLEDGATVSIKRGGEDQRLTRGGQLSSVGRDAAGNLRVLDGSPVDFGPTARHWMWQLDEQGNFVPEGEETVDGAAIVGVEGIFNTDFNKDGRIEGQAKTVIARNGAATLSADPMTGIAYVSVGGAAPVAVTRDGWGDVQAKRGAWELTAVAVDDQGRTRVLDANPYFGTRYAWILDANGHFTGEQSFDADHNGEAERMFSVDLDGDGVVDGGQSGTRLIAPNGGTALDTDQANGAPSVAGTRESWGDVQAQRGAWSLLAIADDDQGRTHVLKGNPFDDARYAWTLDADGRWTHEQPFNRASQSAAELVFSTDLNRDRAVGGHGTMVVGSQESFSTSLA